VIPEKFEDQTTEILTSMVESKRVMLQEELSKLKFNNYNRPDINKKIDFNISHSGEYIAAAIAKKRYGY
jgi:phosphopantetheinyl transferase